jgi:NDP-sugar pyrophosphorylase family protein
MSKRAVVLAGGTGTRLRPYTIVLPKPLMPIGDYPILEVIVRQLVWQGFTQIRLRWPSTIRQISLRHSLGMGTNGAWISIIHWKPNR